MLIEAYTKRFPMVDLVNRDSDATVVPGKEVAKRVVVTLTRNRLSQYLVQLCFKAFDCATERQRIYGPASRYEPYLPVSIRHDCGRRITVHTLA